MVVNINTHIKAIASFLKVKLDNKNSNNVPNSGITSTIFKLLSKSQSTLGPRNQLETVEIQQWIEYIIIYVIHIDNAQNAKVVLKELNDILSLKTYLVSHRLTIADILLFYILTNIMDSLSNLEKEKHLNLCRWFDNLQHDKLLKRKNKVIDFSSNYLATLVPAKH